MINIHFFEIDTKKKKLQYILSQENGIFFPTWWKIRERKYIVPYAYETIFPLKKAIFDNIEVCVPGNTKKYLQKIYGKNLAPAKIYNEKTCKYEKDLTHPYWKRSNAH